VLLLVFSANVPFESIGALRKQRSRFHTRLVALRVFQSFVKIESHVAIECLANSQDEVQTGIAGLFNHLTNLPIGRAQIVPIRARLQLKFQFTFLNFRSSFRIHFPFSEQREFICGHHGNFHWVRVPRVAA